jgi:hypothetical protein
MCRNDPTHTERRRNPKGNGTLCVECSLIRQRASAKREHARYRSLVLENYGGKCACCGESEPVFLAVDHVNNDGAEHRRELGLGRSTTRWLKWLIDHDYPDEFQLLCHNCNYAKSQPDGCPHQR